MVNKIWWVGATSPITIRQGGEGPPAGDHHSRPLHRVVSGVGGTPPQPSYLLLFDINILSQYSEKAPTGAKVPTGTSLNIEKTMYKYIGVKVVEIYYLPHSPHAPCQCSQVYCCLCPGFCPALSPTQLVLCWRMAAGGNIHWSGEAQLYHQQTGYQST